MAENRFVGCRDANFRAWIGESGLFCAILVDVVDSGTFLRWHG